MDKLSRSAILIAMSFEHPPKVLWPIWNALADVTGWFHWDALGAIGTVGALWFAVAQSTKAGRADRIRQIGTLTTLMGLVQSLADFDVPAPGHPLRLPDVLSNSKMMSMKPKLEHVKEGLRRVPMAEIAAVGAVERVNELQVAIQTLIQSVPNNENDLAPYEEIGDQLLRV